MLTGLFSLLFHRTQGYQSSSGPTHNLLVVPYHLLIKKMLSGSPILWMTFLTRASLFSCDYGLSQVDIAK